jgi:ankyrin repeat protein
MAKTLPARPSLEWLKKTARQTLAARRADTPEARLAEVQRDLARDYGFPNWRALRAHVDRVTAPVEAEVSAFLRAIRDGDAGTVGAALAAAPALVNAVGPHPSWGGRPQALHVAIETNRADMFDLLLEAGADVNGHNEAYDNWSPLMLACSPGREAMRATLLRRGARVGLAEALLMKDDERVAVLLAGELPALAPNGGSFLALARTPFAIDHLLAAGASPDAKDHWGTAPIEALSRNDPDGRELVRHMMMRGVTPRPQEFARLGDRNTLAMLVEADPAIAQQEAVLMAAIESGDRALVDWLLGKGASPNARSADESRHSALHAAAWAGDLRMVKRLVAADADLHTRDSEHHETPRGWAEAAINITNNPDCAEVAAWLAAQGG